MEDVGYVMLLTYYLLGGRPTCVSLCVKQFQDTRTKYDNAVRCVTRWKCSM